MDSTSEADKKYIEDTLEKFTENGYVQGMVRKVTFKFKSKNESLRDLSENTREEIRMDSATGRGSQGPYSQF